MVATPQQYETEHQIRFLDDPIPLLASLDGQDWREVGQWVRTRRGGWTIQWKGQS